MLQFAEIREISRLIERKEVSPVELTRLMLDRIDAFDGQLNAYAYVMADEAMLAARTAESEILRGRWRGPLHGVPLAVKDLCWTRGAPTTGGTVVLHDFIPDEDATVVARLRDHGAVILGKLRMSEAAFSDHHPSLPTPVNPWDAGTWIGASSSGSAAATSAGLCFASLGSDTGGSIRFPSAATGLTGVKPTWGRVSRHGILEFAGSLDHIGPIARSAWDCALVLGVIAGEDLKDPTSLDVDVPDYVESLTGMPSRLRIGVDRTFTRGFDEETLAAVATAESVFQAAGGTLVEVTLPDVAQIVDDWMPYCGIEAAVAHGETYPSRRDEYGPQVAELLDLGRSLSALDYQRMLIHRREFSGSLQRVFKDVDVLLLPPFGLASPTIAQMQDIGIGQRWRTVVMKATCPFDMSGNPTISLPCGFTQRGTPLGFQMIGPRLSEALLLRLGHAYQELTDFHTQHPQAYQ